MQKKGHQGACIKDPRTKSKRGRIEGGRWRVWGNGGGKMETTVLEQQ